ncbi:transketolase family protein [Vibrio sp. MEBiC08052]|uniref:transketolase family protein n=1 Tax=Vibrio sp. MEBiC08052 TaxID=1761910 RepID=UPI00074066B3|nr:transketolase C-terminal domain-containing protein [Vibrio sp. MEBiC08052]KUJ00617.1 hypothetical protein VRK_01190 [Vibrio sp. MEBiC08052]
MRANFVQAITDLAEKDKNVILLTGDLGFGSFEVFEEKFPNQYFNVGIAEQSMIGIAAGLAKSGKTVFVYSIGNFVTLRCLEQIRNDACYHHLNINLVSQGGGFTYGPAGMSHHATEDIGIMRVLPYVTICVPSNGHNCYEAVHQLADLSGVGYLRLEKSNNINEINNISLNIGKPNIIREGKDALIISIGGILSEVLKAVDESSKDIAVIDFHTAKPIDNTWIAEQLKLFPLIISVEEHQKTGGLGTILSEVIADKQISTKLVKLGISDEIVSIVGSQEYLREKCLIDSKMIKHILNMEL